MVCSELAAELYIISELLDNYVLIHNKSTAHNRINGIQTLNANANATDLIPEGLFD